MGLKIAATESNIGLNNTEQSLEKKEEIQAYARSLQMTKSNAKANIKNTKETRTDINNSAEQQLEHQSEHQFFQTSRPITYYIRTFGCSHNQSDGEQISGLLSAAGYSITKNRDDADMVIFNSCAVKGPGQELLAHLIAEQKHRINPSRIIVSGCIPQSMPNSKFLEGTTQIGVQQFDRIVDVADSLFRDDNNSSPMMLLNKSSMPRLDLPKMRNNSLVEIIPINLGCLNSCTYCKTKHARGHLRSYPIDDIIGCARSAIAQGVTQIWLTSEDLGAYGKDIGVTLPQLINRLLESIPSNIMIRLGMTNPPYAKEYLNELCEILNHKQVFSFIHIPVQAASNSVLSHMKRGYTIEDFQECVDALRKDVIGITIATDIICGYPTETKEDFKKTIDLVAHNEFPIMNISQFYARPGTAAAKLKPIPSQEVKHRSTELTAIFKSQKPYEKYYNKTLEAWIISSSDDNLWSIGHTKNYIQVLIPKDDSLLGKRVLVKITKTGKHFIQGHTMSKT